MHGTLAEGTPLLLIGSPMDAEDFTTLAAHFRDRPVITWDPRGIGRSRRTLVAHEAPISTLLPDREALSAVVEDIHQTYHRDGMGHAMAKFIALISHDGPLPDAFELPVTDPALLAADARILPAHGEGEQMAARGARAVAEILGVEPIGFPGDHSGFLGGEYGMRGEPDAFAARLREVLPG